MSKARKKNQSKQRPALKRKVTPADLMKAPVVRAKEVPVATGRRFKSVSELLKATAKFQVMTQDRPPQYFWTREEAQRYADTCGSFITIIKTAGWRFHGYEAAPVAAVLTSSWWQRMLRWISTFSLTLFFMWACPADAGKHKPQSSAFDKTVNQTLDVVLEVGAEWSGQHRRYSWAEMQVEVARRLRVKRVEPWNR